MSATRRSSVETSLPLSHCASRRSRSSEKRGGQALHQVGDQRVGLLDRLAWLVDEARLDLLPALREPLCLVVGEERLLRSSSARVVDVRSLPTASCRRRPTITRSTSCASARSRRRRPALGQVARGQFAVVGHERHLPGSPPRRRARRRLVTRARRHPRRAARRTARGSGASPAGDPRSRCPRFRPRWARRWPSR